MARIQKRGLDYFPLNAGFIHDRSVCRLVKKEGSPALSVLIETLSYIYGGEGYYVLADRLFFEDVSYGFPDLTASDVERILRSAADYGIFDSAMLAEHGVLTSADIQRQYLLCTCRRSAVRLEPAYCLLGEDEMPKEKKCGRYNSAGKNATLIPENVASGTQRKEKESKEKESKAEQKKENPPLSLPQREKAEEECTSTKREEEEEGAFPETRREERMDKSADPQLPPRRCVPSPSPAAPPAGIPHGGVSPQTPPQQRSSAPAPRQEWTQERIDALCPPADGRARNFSGLLENLRAYKIPPSEQYAIIRKSDYGAIGGEVWKALSRLRLSGGKIRLPGHYLLSVVNQRSAV